MKNQLKIYSRKLVAKMDFSKLEMIENYATCELFSWNINLFNRPVPVDGINDIAAILCSSGTTGLSKGE